MLPPPPPRPPPADVRWLDKFVVSPRPAPHFRSHHLELAIGNAARVRGNSKVGPRGTPTRVRRLLAASLPALYARGWVDYKTGQADPEWRQVGSFDQPKRRWSVSVDLLLRRAVRR